ncbi:MAG: hypothetical protein J6Y43_08030 [Clostridia bacterium]|nr:hypothetical protein [Clostridia bacterium]
MFNFLYIDAAATTAIISAATAAVVALAAWGIVQWRKFKKGVNKVFHVGENANKEKEADLVITDDETAAEEINAPETDAEETAESSEDDKENPDK